MLYTWTTYPLTCLLERVWVIGNHTLEQEKHPELTLVEFDSALERALNFMHTGNVAVIATSVMNPLWIGLAIIHDGLPCLNPTIVPTLTSSVFVNSREWPCNTRHQPRSASKGSQLRTYGEGHFNVSKLAWTSCRTQCFVVHDVFGPNVQYCRLVDTDLFAPRTCSTCEVFSAVEAELLL